MKLRTKEFLLFAISFAILTAGFIGLKTAILTAQTYVWLWLLAPAYGLLSFIAGYYWGRQDYLKNQSYAIGLKYHFTTYIIFFFLSFAYYGFSAAGEQLAQTFGAFLIWSPLLIVHIALALYWKRKNGIRGIEWKEIFE